MTEYEKYQDLRLAEHEARCRRCGVCCGSTTDPCADLKLDNESRYYCKSYENRFGGHITVSGRKFTCVPIRDVLVYTPPSTDCGYA